MTTPAIHERVANLESTAFRTVQELKTINGRIDDMAMAEQEGKSIPELAGALFGAIDDRLDNHGKALSSTMQDLALARQDLASIKETQAAHTEALQQIQTTLTALVERG